MTRPKSASARKPPVAAEDFTAALAELCATLNIKVEATDTGVYLLEAKIQAKASARG